MSELPHEKVEQAWMDVRRELVPPGSSQLQIHAMKLAFVAGLMHSHLHAFKIVKMEHDRLRLDRYVAQHEDYKAFTEKHLLGFGT